MATGGSGSILKIVSARKYSMFNNQYSMLNKNANYVVLGRFCKRSNKKNTVVFH